MLCPAIPAVLMSPSFAAKTRAWSHSSWASVEVPDADQLSTEREEAESLSRLVTHFAG